MREKMNSVFTRIPNNAVTIVSLLSGLCTIFTFVAKILEILVFKNQGSNVNVPTWLVWMFLSLFCVTCFVWMAKYKKMTLNLVISTTNCIKNIHEAEKNTYYDLLKHHKLCNGSDNVELLTEKMCSFLQTTVDSVCDVLQKYTGKDISGCVKLIESEDPNNIAITYENAIVRTVCRSDSSKAARKENLYNRPQKIIDNTDFYSILCDTSNSNKGYFYQRDLVEYDKQLKAVNNGMGYRNTTLNWENYYRSTVVVPVKIDGSKLFFSPNQTTQGYHVIAFLCFDSMSTDVFTDTRESYIVNLVSGAADAAYLILNQYSYYLNKIAQRGN